MIDSMVHVAALTAAVVSIFLFLNVPGKLFFAVPWLFDTSSFARYPDCVKWQEGILSLHVHCAQGQGQRGYSRRQCRPRSAPNTQTKALCDALAHE